MTITRTAAGVCLTALCSLPVLAASTPPADLGDDTRYSSSAALPDAPAAGLSTAAAKTKAASLRGGSTRFRLGTAPFSSVAIGLTSGTGGLGFDLATPLATKINLRLSASFFDYHPSVIADNIPIDAAIKFRSFGAGIDLYPYHNTFHITF